MEIVRAKMATYIIGVVEDFDRGSDIGLALNGEVEIFFSTSPLGLTLDDYTIEWNELMIYRRGRRIHRPRYLLPGDEFRRIVEEDDPEPIVVDPILPPPAFTHPVKAPVVARKVRASQPKKVDEAVDLPEGRRVAIERGLFHRRW